MSLDVALNNARSGLSLINRQLAQTADNVSNAGTAGYTRKTVLGQSVVASGEGYGVRAMETQRQVDNALLVSINAARASKAGAEVKQQLLQGVELAHGSPGSADSLGDLLGTLRAKLISLRDSPSESLQQGQVVAAAGDVVNRLHTLTNAITTARQQAQDGIVSDVAALNEKLKVVASLTTQIQSVSATGHAVVSLEDQRDAAVADIASLIEVRAVRKDDGGITLISRGGIVLPLNAEKDAFSVSPASVGPDAYYGPGGSLPGVMLNGTDVTAQLQGGTLAAHVEMRDRTLPLYQAEIDVEAAQLARRFDAQGLTLFVGADGSMLPDITQPYATGGTLGFAGDIQVNPAVIADVSLVRDGTRDVADGENSASGFTANPDDGPASFTTLIDRVLNYTFGTKVSEGNAQPGFATTGLGPLGNLSSPLGAASSIEDYAALATASQTGARSDAQTQATAADDMLTTLESRYSAQSGVDIDTEMSSMVTLQNAYAANARIISAVQAMYDSLFAAAR